MFQRQRKIMASGEPALSPHPAAWKPTMQNGSAHLGLQPNSMKDTVLKQIAESPFKSVASGSLFVR